MKKMIVLLVLLFVVNFVFASGEWGDINIKNKNDTEGIITQNNVTEGVAQNKNVEENLSVSFENNNVSRSSNRYTFNFYLALGVGIIGIGIVMLFIYLFLKNPKNRWKRVGLLNHDLFYFL